MARLFVTFKPSSSFKDKVMVFTGFTYNQVQDTMCNYYGKAWAKIYNEPEMAQLLPTLYYCTDNRVNFGDTCTYTDDCSEQTYYPEQKAEVVNVNSITNWFKQAKPKPTEKDFAVQLGVMYEEVAESIEAIFKDNHYDPYGDSPNVLYKAHKAIKELADMLKEGNIITMSKEAQVELLDALADITVTAVGSAYMANMNFDGAINEVNDSNYSKFENGKPVFNEQGKIAKGKDYFKPNLEKFV